MAKVDLLVNWGRDNGVSKSCTFWILVDKLLNSYDKLVYQVATGTSCIDMILATCRGMMIMAVMLEAFVYAPAWEKVGESYFKKNRTILGLECV